jgi:hypothetical protein
MDVPNAVHLEDWKASLDQPIAPGAAMAILGAVNGDGGSVV